ncbi:epoxide hydrolase N-terminal domain-containing protein, partial [Phenylobacterium sp.]|uniref:epoxide hydrolase N-terminal domain-containing protein n=1 Tax=Phenylobacterium sp. TaxID=1871053 RepID=UPI00387E4F55
MNLRPFEIHVPEARLQDLRARLRDTRWPTGALGQDWDEGSDLIFVQRLTHHWLTAFD